MLLLLLHSKQASACCVEWLTPLHLGSSLHWLIHDMLGSTPHLLACLQAIVEAASLNEDGKQRKIIVTGCLAQRYGDTLATDLPEADIVMGFQVRRLPAGHVHADQAQVTHRSGVLPSCACRSQRITSVRSPNSALVLQVKSVS